RSNIASGTRPPTHRPAATTCRASTAIARAVPGSTAAAWPAAAIGTSAAAPSSTPSPRAARQSARWSTGRRSRRNAASTTRRPKRTSHTWPACVSTTTRAGPAGWRAAPARLSKSAVWTESTTSPEARATAASARVAASVRRSQRRAVGRSDGPAITIITAPPTRKIELARWIQRATSPSASTGLVYRMVRAILIAAEHAARRPRDSRRLLRCRQHAAPDELRRDRRRARAPWVACPPGGGAAGRVARARSPGRRGALAMGPGRFHREPLDRRALPRLPAGWARRHRPGDRRQDRGVASRVQSAGRRLEYRRSRRGAGARRRAAGGAACPRHLELQRLRAVHSGIARAGRSSRLRGGFGRGGRGEARSKNLRAGTGPRACCTGRGGLYRGSLLDRRAWRPRCGIARRPARPGRSLGRARLSHRPRPCRRHPPGADVALTRSLGVLLLAVVVASCASASTQGDLDTALYEAVHTVPVPGTDSTIVITSFRPPGAGPFSVD